MGLDYFILNMQRIDLSSLNQEYYHFEKEWILIFASNYYLTFMFSCTLLSDITIRKLRFTYSSIEHALLSKLLDISTHSLTFATFDDSLFSWNCSLGLIDV